MKATGEAVARTTRLPSGDVHPILGQGTWRLGETAGRRKDEVTALCTALDLGMTLIDTAEMYGNGAAEELVGEAIADRRDEIFLGQQRGAGKCHPSRHYRGLRTEPEPPRYR